MKTIKILIAIFLIITTSSFAFIEREFTTREIVDACTNIVVGKVENVSNRRLTATIKVEKDLKGKTRFKQMRFNFSTGQYRPPITTPEKMVSKLRKDLPIIILYRDSHEAIESLCFIDGTWFQMRYYGPGSVNGWWSFTHIDPKMSRTFDGKMSDYQRIIQATIDGEKWIGVNENEIKVLVLTGNSTYPVWGQVPVYTNSMTHEYKMIRTVQKVGDREIAYESTTQTSLPDLENADLLWIGNGEISYMRYLLNNETEKKIKKFVENGGVVVVTCQDSTKDRPCPTNWLVGDLRGVEIPPIQTVEITEKGREIFSKPNEIPSSGAIYIDDAWENWDDSFEILATAGNGKRLVIGTRPHGKGLYIITALRNDDELTVYGNTPMIQNLIHFAVKKIRSKK